MVFHSLGVNTQHATDFWTKAISRNQAHAHAWFKIDSTQNNYNDWKLVGHLYSNRKDIIDFVHITYCLTELSGSEDEM